MAHPSVLYHLSPINETDIYLFKEGRHYHLFDRLGSRIMEDAGVRGVFFAVWAPNAERVSVIGDFNEWDPARHPLAVRWDSSGIWEGFIPGIGQGALYKYSILSHTGQEFEKGDPFAFLWEIPPRTASVVWDLSYEWTASHTVRDGLNSPISIYELHYGSWQRKPEEGNRPLTYREMADVLPMHVKRLGFTHVELMPMMEHPFYGSWGYQKVGYFAPSSRYGTPQDFMHLIEALHDAEIGVFLDWVPSHFPSDAHGLAYFDGTHLYEHEDRRKGFHPEWKSYIFNYGRHEVRSFLISSALFWLAKYQVDGLRVDGVSSMLYLDYSRENGDWIPNAFGGNENLEAIDFLRDLNAAVYEQFPCAQMIAEESTAWPMVSRPTYVGGLGFGMKWNMGWMHDTLLYFSKDPIYRKYHQNDLTFSMVYHYNENFVLSLSHDEVVYGKGSLLGKMPGDEWQKFAQLRLLYTYLFSHPGKKLLFMGAEIGQWSEWNHEMSLDWHLLQYDRHQGIENTLIDLNHLYTSEKALYEGDFSPEGFSWIDPHDSDNSVLSFCRKSLSSEEVVVVLCNFTPVPRINYVVGVPCKGMWQEVFNSDATRYGGCNLGNAGLVEAREQEMHHYPYSLVVTLPPLAGIIFKTKAE